MRVLALAALLVAVTAVAPSAAAQQEVPSARITGVTVEDDQLQVGFATSVGQLDTDSIELSLDGQPVEADVVSLEASGVSRTAVLAIDSSGSMDGEPIEQAKAAAIGFIEAVPEGTLVGLVTFSGVVDVDVEPTTERAPVADAIEAIELDVDTALYDAVLVSLETAGAEGFRSVILLTDGQNSSGTATLEDAVAAAGDAGIPIDAVALGEADTEALAKITEASGGSLLRADEADKLVGLYEEQAQAVADEVVLVADVADVPETTGGVTVSVTAEAGGQEVTANAVVALPTGDTSEPATTGGAEASTPPAALAEPWFVPLAVAAVFLGFVGIFLVAFGPLSRRRKDTVTKRLAVYSMASKKPTEVEHKESSRSSAVATQALGLADQVVKTRGIEPTLENTLSSADVPMTPAEWLLAHTGSTIAGGLLFLLISSFNPWWALVGLLVGLAIPFVILNIRKSNREKEFSEQLPDTLTLMAGSLSAGFSLPQAVDSVVKEGLEPISGEMQKAIVEARLGVPIEEALENIAIRTQNKDFAWVVMAIRIQRQVGGNLSEILRIVAETLRERAYLRRQIRTLSAEGRISAVIIAAMPFVMLLYLLFVRPEYITLLFTETLGLVMVFGALILQLIGWFWMRKLVTFEV